MTQDGQQRIQELPQGVRVTLGGAKLRLWLLGSLRFVATLAAVAGLLGVPLLLLSGYLGPGWGWRFALIFLLAAVFVVLTAWELWALFRLSRPEQLSRLVEQATPELGDRLTSSVLLNQQLPPGASAELARAHISKTAKALLANRAGAQTLGLLWRRTRLSVFLGSCGLLVACGAVLTLPQALQRGIASLGPSAIEFKEPEALPPLVTDLTLEYNYPAYMQRQPRTIEGTTGDIVAPRGTEVTISGLADRAITGASIAVGGERQPLQLKKPRSLSGRIVVSEESRYRFVLINNGTELAERDGHAIRVEADQHPEVKLLKPATDMVVREHDVVEVSYSAKDDFGLKQSRLVIQNTRGGDPHKRSLDNVTGSLRRLGGSIQLELSTLSVQPGDRLAISVEAEDNDTVSGPKVGSSEVRVIKVFSASEHHEELLSRLQAFFQQLVLVLADELENPFEPEQPDTEVARQQLQLARKISDANQEAMATLHQLTVAFQKDKLAPKELRRALLYVYREISRFQDNRASLLAALESYFEVANRYQGGYAGRLQRGQVKRIEALEQHLLYLEDLLNRERLNAAQMAAEEMAKTQDRLAELLEKYKEAGDEETRQQILAELDRLQQKLTELMQRMARMRRDMSDEYVNPEMMEKMFAKRDMGNQLDKIKELLAQGKVDEALAQLEELRAQTQKLQDDMQQSEEMYGGEAYAELRKKLSELKGELDEIEMAQRQLMEENQRRYQEEVESLRKRMGMDAQKLAQQLQKEVKKVLELIDKVDPSHLESYEERYRSESRELLDDTGRALQVEDLDAARESAMRGLSALSGLEANLERRLRTWAQEADRRAVKARKITAEASQRTARIVDALDKMFPSPESLRKPAMAKALRSQSQAQKKLQQRTRKAESSMQQLGTEVPIFGPDHEELLRQASSEMGRASGDLRAREMAGAGNHQREALAKLSELRESMDKMGQNGSGQGMPLPWGGVGGGRGDGMSGSSEQEKVEIPKADDSKAPAAFRRDILEAMKEPPPDSYQDAVRRYYEELVK